VPSVIALIGYRIGWPGHALHTDASRPVTDDP
jgi:hypothetical protein